MILLIFIKNFTLKFSGYNSLVRCDFKCQGFKFYYSLFMKYFYINNIKFNYNLELKNNVKNDLSIYTKFSFTVIYNVQNFFD